MGGGRLVRAGAGAGVDWGRRAVGYGGHAGRERARRLPCGRLACLRRAASPRNGARAIGGLAAWPPFDRVRPARWPPIEGAGLWATRAGPVAARRD